MRVQFALIIQTSARPMIVYERTITSRVNLPQATPDAIAHGYGTALSDILSQAARKLSAQDLRPSTSHRQGAVAVELRTAMMLASSVLRYADLTVTNTSRR